MVDGYAAGDVGQDRMAVFVNGEEEVAAWREAYSNNVLAMCEREGVGFVAVASRLAVDLCLVAYAPA